MNGLVVCCGTCHNTCTDLKKMSCYEKALGDYKRVEVDGKVVFLKKIHRLLYKYWKPRPTRFITEDEFSV